MQKLLIIFLISLFSVFTAKAQLENIDSIKNEIGININPLLQPFGINTNFDYMTIQYKHHYEMVSLRFGFGATLKSTFDDKDMSKFEFKKNDTLQAIFHNYEVKNSFNLNLGIEQHIMLQKKLMFLYGLDLIGGLSTHEYRVETNVYKLGPDSIFTPVQYYNDSTTTTFNYILGGLAFVAGFDYMLFDRVSAGIQGYFPMYYEFDTGETTDKTSSLNIDGHFSIMIKMRF